MVDAERGCTSAKRVFVDVETVDTGRQDEVEDKGFLYINDDRLGEVDFKVIDKGMGAIGGELTVYPAYEKYKKQFQFRYEIKGIANVDDYNFVIVLEDDIILRPAGGIGVTDSAELEEIYVESAGIDFIRKVACISLTLGLRFPEGDYGQG